MEDGMGHGVDHQHGRWEPPRPSYDHHHQQHPSHQQHDQQSQQHGAHPAGGGMYALPPKQQHYYHPLHHPQHAITHHYPQHQAYPDQHYAPPPLPPLPTSSSSTGSSSQVNYYYSAPHGPPHQLPLPPAPQGYDWSGAPLPPIRLHPPIHSYGHSAAASPPPPLPHLTHAPISSYAPAAPLQRSASVSSSSNRDADGSTYGGSAGGSRWAPYESGAPEVKGEEQEQFESSVQALQSLAHASTAGADYLPPRDDQGGQSDDEGRGPQPITSTSHAVKGKAKARAKTYASSGSDGGEEVGEDGQKIKKRKRRRKASEQPRDAANRKFMCETCKKLFARPSALATHERSHSKEKPHICPFPTCRRPFAVPSNLRRHQRVYNHHDPSAASTPTSASVTPSASPTSVSAPLEASHLPLPLPPLKQIPPLNPAIAPIDEQERFMPSEQEKLRGSGTKGLAWSE